MKTIRVGTRASRLAQRQTQLVIDRLRSVFPDLSVSVILISTGGDRDTLTPLPAWENQGMFVSDLEQALLNDEIDLAVHSLKDLPTQVTPGLVVAAIPERADVRDVVVSGSRAGLLGLPAGSRVGTSSLRRRAQVLAARPDVSICDLRGNVDTRIGKVQRGDVDAAILAAAGIERLDLAASIAEYLPINVMTPAPAQGALAVETRVGDPVMHLLQTLDHKPTRTAVLAERVVLAGLGGGCHVPIGAYGIVEGAQLLLVGMVASPEGTAVLRDTISGQASRPVELGHRLAARLLRAGAADLLQQSPAPSSIADGGTNTE